MQNNGVQLTRLGCGESSMRAAGEVMGLLMANDRRITGWLLNINPLEARRESLGKA